MTTATRSDSQVASDGVRVAWKASDSLQHETGAFVVQRSMDGVVRIRRTHARDATQHARSPSFGTIVLSRWTGAMDGVRVPQLGMGA